jgi:hypothetical protein
MKESNKYIRFANYSYKFVLTGLSISLFVSYIYFINYQTDYVSKNIYEISENKLSIEEKKLMTDQFVMYLRNENVLKKLNLVNVDINSYKTGPIAFSVEINSKEKELSEESLRNIEVYFNEKYSISAIGESVVYSDKIDLINIFIIVLSGAFFSVIASLVLLYFRKY